MIFLEDCQTTINRVILLTPLQSVPISYDMVITSPPDYDELGIDPGCNNEYNGFVFYDRLIPIMIKSKYSVVILRDRKYNGSVISKHMDLIEAVKNQTKTIKLLTHKIWVRSYKTNLYKFNYSHILTFGKKGNGKYLPDVFFHEHNPVEGYKENFEVDILKPFIECYTTPDETVYDPFMGSGTTAIAALQLGRNYLGSEVDPTLHKMACDRIAHEQGPIAEATSEMVVENGSTPISDSYSEEKIKEYLQLIDYCAI